MITRRYHRRYLPQFRCPKYDICRLNSEDFSKFFLCLGILFLTFSYERTHQEVQEKADFFRIFWNIHDFFDFLEVFRIKLFCPARCSHVLCTIRFPIKFHIGLSMSCLCETLLENALMCLIGLTGVQICVGSVKIK